MEEQAPYELSDIRITEKLPTCGLVMPISSIEDCPAEHWIEVQSILRDVIKKAGFEANLVSDSDESGIIQKRIIQNLYNNEIVVCDVSCKNPNVMFELGLRLAFDKATIIVKDDKTDYTFDTGVIEHLGYPRDLRWTKINLFKDSLQKKLEATYKKSKDDSNYSTFLKNFGEYTVAKIANSEVSTEKFMLTKFEELKDEIQSLKRQNKSFMGESFHLNSSMIEHQIRDAVIEYCLANDIAFNSISRKSTYWKDLVYYIVENTQILKFYSYDEREKVILRVLSEFKTPLNAG